MGNTPRNRKKSQRTTRKRVVQRGGQAACNPSIQSSLHCNTCRTGNPTITLTYTGTTGSICDRSNTIDVNYTVADWCSTLFLYQLLPSTATSATNIGENSRGPHTTLSGNGFNMSTKLTGSVKLFAVARNNYGYYHSSTISATLSGLANLTPPTTTGPTNITVTNVKEKEFTLNWKGTTNSSSYSFTCKRDTNTVTTTITPTVAPVSPNDDTTLVSATFSFSNGGSAGWTTAKILEIQIQANALCGTSPPKNTTGAVVYFRPPPPDISTNGQIIYGTSFPLYWTTPSNNNLAWTGLPQNTVYYRFILNDVEQSYTHNSNVGTTTSYSINSLSPGTTYSIYVNIHSGTPPSAQNFVYSSNTISVTTAPAPPTNIQQTNSSYSTVSQKYSLSLSWDPSPTATSYSIATTPAVSSTISGTTATLTGLAHSTSISVTVRAVNSSGSSSDASTAITVKTGPTPPSLTATNSLSSNSFRCNWTNGAGTGTLSIEFQVRPSGPTLTSTPTTSPAVWNSADSNTTYYVSAITRSSINGPSSRSDEVALTPLLAAPTGLVASNITKTGFTLQWTPVPGSNPIISYALKGASTATVSWTSPTAEISGLTAGTTYSITINFTTTYYYGGGITNGIGNSNTRTSPDSAALSVSTLPAPPTAITITTGTITTTGCTVTMTGYTSQTGWPVTLSYTLNGGSSIAVTTAATVTIPLSTLTPGETNTFIASATNAGGTTTATRVLGTPPVQPTDISVSAVSGSTFRLNWTSTNGSSTNYLFTIGGNSVTPSSVGTNFATFSGLNANTAYSFTISASANGTTTPASTVSVTTGPASPVITGFSNINGNGFTVSWTGGVGATSYSYTVNGVNATPISTSGNSARFSGYSMGASLPVIINAINVAGTTSSVSSTVTLLTLQQVQASSAVAETISGAQASSAVEQQASSALAEVISGAQASSAVAEAISGAQASSATAQEASSALAEAISGAQASSATAQEASSALAEAISGARASSATVQQASSAVAEAISGAQASSATAQQASSAVAEAISGAQASSAIAQQASSALAEAISGAQASSAIAQQASSALAEAISGARQSSATAQQASSAVAEAISGARQSSATAQQASSAVAEAISGAQESSATAQQASSALEQTASSAQYNAALEDSIREKDNIKNEFLQLQREITAMAEGFYNFRTSGPSGSTANTLKNKLKLLETKRRILIDSAAAIFKLNPLYQDETLQTPVGNDVQKKAGVRKIFDILRNTYIFLDENKNIVPPPIFKR